MRAHAKLRVERVGAAGSVDRGAQLRMPLLRSQGALVLRPTREALPPWAARWNIDPALAATVRTAAGSAGPLGGDRWRLDVDVAQGAALMLQAVSAVLMLPGAHGAQSHSEVNITVADGASLIWVPGTQIAGAGCSHFAVNRIDLAEGARLYLREQTIIGRHDERPGNLRQRLRVTRGGAALYDQELAVGPDHGGWDGPAVTGGHTAIGSILLVDTDPEHLGCFREPVSTAVPDTAVMRLTDNAVLVTSLAADAVDLRARLDAAFRPFGR